MTVATDLASQFGAHICGYLAIEGIQPYFFEYSSMGTPTGWSRPIKVCLEPPSEAAAEIDLGECRPQIAAMSFRLQDIKETDGTSYFGKLFATGKWATDPHARMAKGSSYYTQVDANATNIPLQAVGQMGSYANGYITKEAINWSTANSDGLFGVTKGLYPPVNVGSTFGYSYARPPDSGKGYLYSVGTAPFSLVGRRVAYYLTSYDKATAAWNAEASSRLIWVGRIGDQIQYEGNTGTFLLSCVSITDELSQKVPTVFSGSYLSKINIGANGGHFKTYTHLSWQGIVYDLRIVNIPAGVYTHISLASLINRQLVGLDGGSFSQSATPALRKTDLQLSWDSSGFSSSISGFKGKSKFEALTSDYIKRTVSPIIVIDSSPNGDTCHALGALGLPSRGVNYITLDKEMYTDRYYGSLDGEKYHVAYHPLSQYNNGSKLYVESADVFWPDQGDASTSQACVKVEDAELHPYWKNEPYDTGNYFARYSSRVTTGDNYLVLTTDPQDSLSRDGYIGQEYGDEKVEVQQVYIPHYDAVVGGKGKPRGPFELLLYPLLSTGTANYNGPYDKCPIDASLAIQKELVDTSSFLQADKYALGPSALGHRKLYVIDKPTSWLELLQRECKIFGYVLCWRSGKLRLRSVLNSPGVDEWTVTLNDTNMTNPAERPTVSSSTATVVNQYSLKISYDSRADKYGPPFIVTDVDSDASISTKRVTIEHPGIYLSNNKVDQIYAILKGKMLERWIRFPLPVLTRSVSMDLMDKIFAGDIVKFQSTHLIPDPYGTGTMVTSALATVTAVKWDYRMHTGQVTIMLHDRALGAAWSPAALIDRTVAGGGFHNAVDQIQLVPYTWSSTNTVFSDGNAVGENSGWAVQIIERAPSNVFAPATFGPWNTTAAYYSGNHCLQLPSGTSLAGFDVTGNTEYFVTFSDWTVINTAQYNGDKGSWQADQTIDEFSDGTQAQRWK